MKIWPPAGDVPGGEYSVGRLIVGDKTYRVVDAYQTRIMPLDGTQALNKLYLHLDISEYFNYNSYVKIALVDTVLLGLQGANGYGGFQNKSSEYNADVYIDCYPDNPYVTEEDHWRAHIKVNKGKVYGSVTGGVEVSQGADKENLWRDEFAVVCKIAPFRDKRVTRNYIIEMSGSFPWYGICPNVPGSIYNYWYEDYKPAAHTLYLSKFLKGVTIPGTCPIYAFPCCDGKGFSDKNGVLEFVDGDLFNNLHYDNYNNVSQTFTRPSYFRGMFAGQSNLRLGKIPDSLYTGKYILLNHGPKELHGVDLSYFHYNVAGACIKDTDSDNKPTASFGPYPQNQPTQKKFVPPDIVGVIPDHLLPLGLDLVKYNAQFGVTIDYSKVPIIRTFKLKVAKMVGFYRGVKDFGASNVLPSEYQVDDNLDLSECFADSCLKAPLGSGSGFNTAIQKATNLSYMYSNCKELGGSPNASCLPAVAADVQGMFQGCGDLSAPNYSFVERLLETADGGELLLSGMFANSGIDDCSWAAPLFSYKGPITAVSMFYNTKVKRADEEFWGSVPDREDVNVNRIFGNCTELTYAYPIWDKFENISASGAYEYCTSLADPPYSEIPEKYKVYDLELWNKKEEEEPT